MSVCVSSALNSGMTTHVSHLHMTSALSMMHPFQNHQMAPSTIDMSSSTSSSSSSHNQVHSQSQSSQNSSSNDPNDPNPEMLLALIARNKSLEGEYENRYTLLPSVRKRVIICDKKF